MSRPTSSADTHSSLAATAESSHAPVVPFQAYERSGTKYFTLKGGWYGTDEGVLDDGYIINGALGHEFSRLFAVELEGGYFEASGDSATIIDNSFGVPLMVNAKLNLPIWIFEAYGGGGLGAVYHQIDFNAGGNANDWTFGGNVFLGADIVLFEKLTGGLELKYYATEETNFGLRADAMVAFITFGLRF